MFRRDPEFGAVPRNDGNRGAVVRPRWIKDGGRLMFPHSLMSTGTETGEGSDTEPVSFVCPIEHTSLSFGFDAATLLAKHLKLLEFPGLSRLTRRVAQALAGQRGTLIL